MKNCDHLLDKFWIFEQVLEQLPLAALAVHVHQADLRVQAFLLPNIQNASGGWGLWEEIYDKFTSRLQMFSQFSVFLCLLLSSLMSSAYQTCSGPRYLLPLSWDESWDCELAHRKGGSWASGSHALFLCQTLFISLERNLRGIDRNLT